MEAKHSASNQQGLFSARCHPNEKSRLKGLCDVCDLSSRRIFREWRIEVDQCRFGLWSQGSGSDDLEALSRPQRRSGDIFDAPVAGKLFITPRARNFAPSLLQPISPETSRFAPCRSDAQGYVNGFCSDLTNFASRILPRGITKHTRIHRPPSPVPAAEYFPKGIVYTGLQNRTDTFSHP